MAWMYDETKIKLYDWQSRLMRDEDVATVLENPLRQAFDTLYKAEILEQSECAQSYYAYANCLLHEPLEEKSEDFRTQYSYVHQSYERMKQGASDRFYWSLNTPERQRYWLAFLAYLKKAAYEEQKKAQRHAFLERIEPTEKECPGPYFVLPFYHGHQFDDALMLCQLPDALIDAPYKRYKVYAMQLNNLYDCCGVMECHFYPQQDTQ